MSITKLVNCAQSISEQCEGTQKQAVTELANRITQLEVQTPERQVEVLFVNLATSCCQLADVTSQQTKKPQEVLMGFVGEA